MNAKRDPERLTGREAVYTPNKGASVVSATTPAASECTNGRSNPGTDRAHPDTGEHHLPNTGLSSEGVRRDVRPGISRDWRRTDFGKTRR
jgi:hypothetical protein